MKNQNYILFSLPLIKVPTSRGRIKNIFEKKQELLGILGNTKRDPDDRSLNKKPE